MPVIHMNHELEELQQGFEEQYRDRARMLLDIPDETFRLAIPERLPLDVAAHLVRRCPACGLESPSWAKLTGLDGDKPLDALDMQAFNTLTCTGCAQVFPGPEFPEDEGETVAGFTYPYHPGRNGERYYFTACAESMRMQLLGYRSVFYPLCVAAMVTGGRAYADKAVALLLLFAERLDRLPMLSFAGATVPSQRGRGIRSLAVDELGQSYGGWFATWGGSYMVTEWALGFDLLGDAAAVTDAVYAEVRDRVIKRVLEVQVYPIHLYMLDKFHNSTTNHYRAIAAALRSFGQGLVVDDIVRRTFRFEGGDLAQDLLYGAKGMHYYAETCFDACGLYAERTSGYQGYAARGLLTTATFLRGHSDPEGYEPGPDVADCFRPIDDFRIERDLPQAARTLQAYVELQASDGMHYLMGDNGYPARRSAEEVRDLSRECPDRRLLAWEQDAVTRGGLPPRGDMPPAVEPQAWPPTDDLVSQEHGLALIKSTGPARETLGLTWGPDMDYHSHWDSLRVTYRAFGRDLFPDLPTLYSSPYRHLWADRTRAHSTVSVNGQRQGKSSGGDLLYCDRSCHSVLLAARDGSVYPELSAYRRDLVLVTDGIPYVVDCFRAQGAALYEQTWVGGSADLTCPGLSLLPSQGRKPGPAFDDPSLWELNPQYGDAGNGERALLQITEGQVTEGQAADEQCENGGLQRAVWQLATSDGSPRECVGELFVQTQADDGVVTAEYPRDITVSPPEPGRMLCIERRSEPGELQVFLSVYQVRPEDEPGIAVQGLDVDGGRGVAITHSSGTDVVLMSLTAGQVACRDREITFDGETLLARFRAGRLVHVHATGGTTLQIGSETVAPPVPECAVSIEAVDIADRRLVVAVRGGDPEALVGQSMRFTHQTGTTSTVRIAAVAPDEDGLWRLECDREASRLHTHCGRVDSILNATALTTRTVGPENMPPRSHVHVDGVCGLLHRSECSGRPLDIDGTTTNEHPREITIHLAEPCLDADMGGRVFWVSAFGAGDEGRMMSRFEWSHGQSGGRG